MQLTKNKCSILHEAHGNQKGLSLLGLLITVIIVGILISILLPRYQKTTTTRHTQNQQTLQQVRQTLHQAEQEAAKRANLDEKYL